MEMLKFNVFNFLNKPKMTTVPLSPTVPHLPLSLDLAPSAKRLRTTDLYRLGDVTVFGWSPTE